VGEVGEGGKQAAVTILTALLETAA
jgi:hypothetical protein